jgi:hypothetical protein
MFVNPAYPFLINNQFMRRRLSLNFTFDLLTPQIPVKLHESIDDDM